MKKITLALSLLLGGCISSAVKDHTETMISIHDGYVRNIEADVAAINQQEWNEAPQKVRTLLHNVVQAVYRSRRSWYAQGYALEISPDPAGLDLASPRYPFSE